MKRKISKSNLQRTNDMPWCRIEFSSCLHRARDVQDEILGRAQQMGFSGHDIFAIKLALEEALVNACKHGNCMNPGKQVVVQYRITPQRADVTIEDEGAGFDPAQVPDPTSPENLEDTHGRGILLMRSYMNNVVYSPAGNRVTLTKFNESGSDTAREAVSG